MQPLVRDNIRLAATVMLVRDTPKGMEVYFVQRPGKGDFPNLHVFPGGKVDEADWAPEICTGISDDEASARLGLDEGGLRYWVAVARECFEECGVLLAQEGNEPLDLSDPNRAAYFQQRRMALLNGEVGFAQICKQEGLTLRCDRLAYFSHWITPDVVPRRFDTRFFLAAMPVRQEAIADTDETAGEKWADAGYALEQHRQQTWQMIDPTLRSLESLTAYNNVADALSGVRQETHLPTLTPQLNAQGMQPLRAES